MKKVMAMMIGIALVAVVAKKTLAVDNQDVVVVMSIQSVGITVDGANLLPVSASPQHYRVASGGVVVSNTGNINEDFSLRITSVAPVSPSTTTWNVVENSTPSVREMQLHAIFAMYKAVPTISTTSFNESDDYLSTSSVRRLSSANNYWCQTCSSFELQAGSATVQRAITPIQGDQRSRANW